LLSEKKNWLARGIGEVRLYHNTEDEILDGEYEDITSYIIEGATSASASVVRDARLPETRYWFWVQALDMAGNPSPITAIGTILTEPKPPAAWEFHESASPGNDSLGPIFHFMESSLGLSQENLDMHGEWYRGNAANNLEPEFYATDRNSFSIMRIGPLDVGTKY
jgi:hypothetical protein